MVQPKLRISPSGPLTVGDTEPLREYAGAFFVGPLAGQAQSTIMDARIGPSGLGGTVAKFSDYLYFTRAGKPQPTDTTHTKGEFSALDAGSDAFTMGAGLWLVEANISCGYNSAPPTSNEYGVLNMVAKFLKDDGTTSVEVFTTRGSIVTKAIAPLPSNSEFDIMRAMVEVTPAAIAANNNQPLSGVALQIVRASSGNGSYSIYGTSSGWLEFSMSCGFSIKRIS